MSIILLMDAGAFFRFRRELFQTKMKIHKRLFALLLVFALVIGMIPSALADNEPDISAVESAEETLVESRPEESPAIAPPTQSILELDEAVEDSEVETDDEAPTSMDGETLTRMDNDGLMLLGGGGTMGKSTCVTFAAYQSSRWKCHRYEVDGSHSYGHFFTPARLPTTPSTAWTHIASSRTPRPWVGSITHRTQQTRPAVPPIGKVQMGRSKLTRSKRRSLSRSSGFIWLAAP